MGKLAMMYPKLHPPRLRRSPLRKKLGLFRSWASRHPLWLAWQITYRCNMRCAFCHYWKEPSHREDELSVEQCREASRRLADLGSILTSLAGGEGRILGTLIGVLVIAVVENAMNLLGIGSYWQNVVLGLIVLCVVLLDMLKRRGWRGLLTPE